MPCGLFDGKIRIAICVCVCAKIRVGKIHITLYIDTYVRCQSMYNQYNVYILYYLYYCFGNRPRLCIYIVH